MLRKGALSPTQWCIHKKKEALGRWSVTEQISALHSSPMFFVFLTSGH